MLPTPEKINDLEEEYEDGRNDGYSLWITYNKHGIYSLDVTEEPPYSNDAGLLQINLSELHKIFGYVLEAQ